MSLDDTQDVKPQGETAEAPADSSPAETVEAEAQDSQSEGKRRRGDKSVERLMKRFTGYQHGIDERIGRLESLMQSVVEMSQSQQYRPSQDYDYGERPQQSGGDPRLVKALESIQQQLAKQQEITNAIAEERQKAQIIQQQGEGYKSACRRWSDAQDPESELFQRAKEIYDSDNTLQSHARGQYWAFEQAAEELDLEGPPSPKTAQLATRLKRTEAEAKKQQTLEGSTPGTAVDPVADKVRAFTGAPKNLKGHGSAFFDALKAAQARERGG